MRGGTRPAAPTELGDTASDPAPPDGVGNGAGKPPTKAKRGGGTASHAAPTTLSAGKENAMKWGLNPFDRIECRFTRWALAFLAVFLLSVFVPEALMALAGVGR